MANKQIHRVSPELTNDAQFKSIESIPTTMLQDGDTILVYPGVYSDPRTANIGNVMVEGFGNSDNVIFNGFSVLSDMPAVAATDAASTVVLTRCMIGENELHGYAVVSHNNSGSLVMRNCHVQSDAGILTNVVAAIEHCTFTGANNYASSVAAGGAGVPTVTVRASVAAAANAGNMTETVVALIS